MYKTVISLFVMVLLVSNRTFPAAAENEVTFHPTYLKVIEKLESLTPGRSIDVKMGVQKERYAIGEPFEMRFQASQECYITLMYINSANGAIRFLIPSQWYPQTKIDGQRVYSTSRDCNLSMMVTPPLEVDVFNLFCSPEKFDFFEPDFAKEPIYTIPAHDETRLTNLFDRLDHLQKLDWSGNSLVIMTGDAAPGGTRGGASRKLGDIPSTDSEKFFPPLDSQKSEHTP